MASEGSKSRKSSKRAEAPEGQEFSSASRRERDTRQAHQADSLGSFRSRGSAAMADTEIVRALRRMLQGDLPETQGVASPMPREADQPQLYPVESEHRAPVQYAPVQRAAEFTGPPVQGMTRTHIPMSYPELVRPNLPRLLKDVRSLGSSTFLGTSDPQVARTWIRALTRNVVDLGLSDAERVLVASRLLEGVAQSWWESLGIKYPHGLTWAEFLGEFNSQYFTAYHVEQRRQEFIHLKQGTKSVAEYEALLRELSEYAPELMDTEMKRCIKFESGLRLEIRDRMIMSGNLVYSEVVHQAFRAEGLIRSRNSIIEGRGEKRKQETEKVSTMNQRPSFGGPHFQPVPRPSGPRSVTFPPRFGPGGRTTSVGSRQGSNVLTCRYCGKAHTGPCRWGVVCYSCGQVGHKQFQCPFPVQTGSGQPTMAGPIVPDQRRPSQLSLPQGKPSETRTVIGSSAPSAKPGLGEQTRVQTRIYALNQEEAQEDLNAITDP